MKKIFESFGCALHGVTQFVASERHARIHLAAAIAAIALGFWLGITSLEWTAIVLCIGFVLSAEAMNTAIEALADAVHPEKHPLIKKAKDVAAGAVLLAAITAATVGAIVFVPKLIP
ncbi:MAG: diacylglycerol kinase family protein [Verrucomicrobiota bacterium]